MTDIIEFNQPTEGQMTAIWRAIRVGEDNNTPLGTRMDALVLVEDILLSCLKDQTSVEDIKTKLAMGKLDLREDLVKPAMNSYGATAKAPTTGPVKTVRRGRPRKSV